MSYKWLREEKQTTFTKLQKKKNCFPTCGVGVLFSAMSVRSLWACWWEASLLPCGAHAQQQQRHRLQQALTAQQLRGTDGQTAAALSTGGAQAPAGCTEDPAADGTTGPGRRREEEGVRRGGGVRRCYRCYNQGHSDQIRFTSSYLCGVCWGKTLKIKVQYECAVDMIVLL